MKNIFRLQVTLLKKFFQHNSFYEDSNAVTATLEFLWTVFYTFECNEDFQLFSELLKMFSVIIYR